MRILLDTSVLVAAMVEAHPAHEKGLTWLKRVTNGADEGLVAAHSLAELYSILTTLPVQPRISPSDARQLIRAMWSMGWKSFRYQATTISKS